jgi:arylsulfatase A-like enzyme
MAEILQQNGYRTVSFNDGGYVSSRFGFDQGFDLYHSFPKTSRGTLKNRVNRAIKWIKENQGEKFFLFLHTYEVHHPYTPKEEYLALFDTDYSGDLPSHITRDLLLEINDNKMIINESDKQHIIDTYDAEIKSMDDSFLVLINFLKNNNLFDNTIIIFTSDHGEEFGEHGLMGWHGTTLFDEVLHIPLIVKFPNSLFSSTAVSQQVSSMDILPTLLDVLDIPKEKIFEGTSLMSLVKGKRKKMYAVSEMGSYGKSIRTQAWKYCRIRSSELLFNLANDPNEQSDVASEQLDVTNRLKTVLESFLVKRRISLPENKANLDKETLEQLKDLGYIR